MVNRRRSRRRIELRPKVQARIEERFKLEEEAEQLLDLVAAEFNSDPMSVQCFDLRIVERVKYVSARLKQLPRNWWEED